MNNNMPETDNENTGAIINKLRARNQELEAENSRLLTENSKQNQVIGKLVKRLGSVDSDFKDWSASEFV